MGWLGNDYKIQTAPFTPFTPSDIRTDFRTFW